MEFLQELENANNEYFDFICSSLKEVVRGLKITDAEVGERCGMKQANVNMILNRKQIASEALLLKVAEGIRIHPLDLREIFRKAYLVRYKSIFQETLDLGARDLDFYFSMRKEFGKDIDNETVEKIKEFGAFLMSRKKS